MSVGVKVKVEARDKKHRKRLFAWNNRSSNSRVLIGVLIEYNSSLLIEDDRNRLTRDVSSDVLSGSSDGSNRSSSG
jgi:hypothetical protein